MNIIYYLSYVGANGHIYSHRTSNIAKAFATAMNNRKPVNLTMWCPMETPRDTVWQPHNFICMNESDVMRAFTTMRKGEIIE